MKLTLLGVIGSVPGGSSDLGKNTTSLLIEDDSYKLIIDAGTGIMRYFDKTKDNAHHILFTHYHLDHILGLPFISELYEKNQSFHLYGPDLEGHTTQSMLSTLFGKPFLPMDVDQITSNIEHNLIEEKHTYNIQSFDVSTLQVDHPGKCMVYSISKNNKKITILTDFPNTHENLKDIIEFSTNSDLIYIDGYLTNQEMNTLSDYGHSSIENAIALFKKTESKKLIISHHKSNRLYASIKEYEDKDIIIAKENATFEM